MRPIPLFIILLSLIPGLAFANDDVQQYIENAISSLRTTSYEARMKFLSPFDPGVVQQVHIFHVAPELYRVIPLENGVEGDLVYIENAVELSRIKDGIVEIMPVRQFSTIDAMTTKFLRDLGRHEGTILLDGIVGDNSVFVLRQDVLPEKPYIITVGLEKTTFFPMFLLVMDATGERRVYFEMEVVEFCDSLELDDNLFVPQGEFATLPPPRMKAPSTVSKTQQLDVETMVAPDSDLPLIPLSSTLPQGFTLESISELTFPTKDRNGSFVVYHLEIFGSKGDVLSIFQTQSDSFSFDTTQSDLSRNQGYALSSIDGWMVAAFGSQPEEVLLNIIENLHLDNFKAEQLLDETSVRQQFLDSIE